MMLLARCNKTKGLARGLGRRAATAARGGWPQGRRDRRRTQPTLSTHARGGWQLLEVRQAADISRAGSQPAEPAVAAAIREQYIWSARYIDAPILRDRDAGEGGSLGKAGSGLDERLYYLTDAHMCVMAVVDAGGAAVERYCYDPYGRVTILNGAADRDCGGGVLHSQGGPSHPAGVASEGRPGGRPRPGLLPGLRVVEDAGPDVPPSRPG